MHTDAQRRQLFNELDTLLTPTVRDILMELLPPVGWSDIARQSDITALRGEISELRAELRGEISELSGEMAKLDARMSRIVPQMFAANIAAMMGVAGLVLGATQLG